MCLGLDDKLCERTQNCWSDIPLYTECTHTSAEKNTPDLHKVLTQPFCKLTTKRKLELNFLCIWHISEPLQHLWPRVSPSPCDPCGLHFQPFAHVSGLLSLSWESTHPHGSLSHCPGSAKKEVTLHIPPVLAPSSFLLLYLFNQHLYSTLWTALSSAL